MPPKESIERVRLWQIRVGVLAWIVMLATSGTRYIMIGGCLTIFSGWFAMFYVTKAIYSFSNYVRTTFPDFYHREEQNAVRRFGFNKSLVQVWPFKSWFIDAGDPGKGVRQKIIDLIPDNDYIQSLEVLQKYYRTAIAILFIDFGSLILFSVLKLWA
jgi:hypothetical protein